MCLQWRSYETGVEKATLSCGGYGWVSSRFESIGGKMLTPKTFSGLSFREINNDKDVTKDRNLSTFKMYCKRRKSGVRFPDRKAKKSIVCVSLHCWPWVFCAMLYIIFAVSVFVSHFSFPFNFRTANALVFKFGTLPPDCLFSNSLFAIFDVFFHSRVIHHFVP